MASKSAHVTIIALAVAASACTATAEPPELTRALLPPTPPLVTTTTTVPVDPVAADQAVQTELRQVLEVTQDVFAERATYDSPAADIGARIPTVNVIGLEEAALQPGVVYDARQQQATLYAHSQSGTWFCVNVSPDGDDYGFGDDFDSALSACSDGVLGADWGDPFSPTGPDESAIEATMSSLAAALAEGDAAGATRAFHPDQSCSDLTDRWPAGLGLSEADELEITSMTITGDVATVEASVGSLSHVTWRLRNGESGWQVQADPCQLLEQVLVDRTSLVAAELLESGLHAVRSAFVVQEDFGFTAQAVANLDAALVWAPVEEVGFGTLYYSGRVAEGVVVTGGAVGSYLCAVESLSAATVYGTGESADEVRTPGRCRAHSN